jgi:hypothetical protein
LDYQWVFIDSDITTDFDIRKEALRKYHLLQQQYEDIRSSKSEGNLNHPSYVDQQFITPTPSEANLPNPSQKPLIESSPTPNSKGLSSRSNTSKIVKPPRVSKKQDRSNYETPPNQPNSNLNIITPDTNEKKILLKSFESTGDVIVYM